MKRCNPIRGTEHKHGGPRFSWGRRLLCGVHWTQALESWEREQRAAFAQATFSDDIAIQEIIDTMHRLCNMPTMADKAFARIERSKEQIKLDRRAKWAEKKAHGSLYLQAIFGRH